MRLSNRIVPALLAALLPLLAGAAEFSSLEERMTQGDFKAAGLEKLSPAELKSLNDWLRVHGLTPDAPVATGGGKGEFYPHEMARENIDTKIAGSFVGWMGKTQWTMENGQVWQQAESGQRRDWHLEQPQVHLKPMVLGSWLMSVEGCGCSVRVQRIK